MKDEDLRQLFAALRREDEARTPAFADVRHRPRRDEPRGRWLVPLAAAALLAGVLLVRPASPPKRPTLQTVPITEWRAPTDFLLRTPGSELLHEMPGLGRSLYPLPSPQTERRNRS